MSVCMCVCVLDISYMYQSISPKHTDSQEVDGKNTRDPRLEELGPDILLFGLWNDFYF